MPPYVYLRHSNSLYARSPQKAARPIVAADKNAAQTPANTASVTALVKKSPFIDRHYLASATKTQRQISAAGEQFVSALPDREAAKLAMTNARARRAPRRKKAK